MLYLVLCISFGLATGIVAKIKGSSFAIWGLLGAVFPVLGLVAAILYRYETAELRRQCERCGNVVKIYDAVCTRCGNELEFPEVAIEPIDPSLPGGRRATV